MTSPETMMWAGPLPPGRSYPDEPASIELPMTFAGSVLEDDEPEAVESEALIWAGPLPGALQRFVAAAFEDAA